MNPYEQLSDAERIRQIGDLLVVAAIRYFDDQPPSSLWSKSSFPKPTKFQVWDLVDDEVEKQVLRLLDLRVAAEPVQIRVALGLSQMTLVRRLARLRASGLVRVTGKTRNARYTLAAPENQN